MERTVGFLDIIWGPMYSQKTTKLVSKISNYALLSDTQALLISHKLDTRDITNKISTHNPTFKNLPTNVKIISVATLAEVSEKDIDTHTVIGIDEMQFFTDLYDNIKKWVKNGKYIIAAGLNGNSKKELFGDVYRLIPEADNIEFCRAICNICIEEYGNKNILTPEILATMKASFSKKISGDKNLDIDIGAADKYIPVCRKHYEEK